MRQPDLACTGSLQETTEAAAVQIIMLGGSGLGPQVYDEENGGEDERQDNHPANQKPDESTVAD
jgi:hypothetical protein